MKYPQTCNKIIDVTKAPYFADNTGKTDCTAVLRRALDDYLQNYIDQVENTKKRLLAKAKKYGGNVYECVENARVVGGNFYLSGTDLTQPNKIFYFPKGVYLISDTLTYTLENLSTQQQRNYRAELCRNIHLLGEDREKTIIRLVNNAKGFERGNKKPVLSFNKNHKEGVETSNVAQLNTLENLTIDCGEGNEGAIGVLYCSSNAGRISGVTVKGNNGVYGIDFDRSSEGCVEDITVSGFDFGMRIDAHSPIVINGADLANNRIAGATSKNAAVIARNVRSGQNPTFLLRAGACGRYYFGDNSITYTGEMQGNFVYYEKEDCLLKMPPFPKKEQSENFDDWVCVDEFGAVCDGIEDASIAIQKAMDSGKSTVYFGNGRYLIERPIKIPSTVKVIDLTYADILPGYSFVVGEMDGIFDVCQSSESPLFIEHFLSSEDCCGFFRFCRQSARRTLVLKDMIITAALYFNTQAGSGSEVYIDNCQTHTNHYTQNAVIGREGYTPVFCRMIPLEVHGQKVYARNLNIERPDVAILNDGSEITVDGYKGEGPSVLLKTVNGGTTQFNLFQAAWWNNRIKENGLFELESSEFACVGGYIFCYPNDEEYCRAITLKDGDKITWSSLQENSEELFGIAEPKTSVGRLIANTYINNKK